jgi:hypothetical protein
VSVSFRNRIILSSGLAAPEEVTERALSPDSRVVLYGPGPDEPIHNAIELRLYGWNYPTPNEALVAGRLWRDHVLIAFAHFGIGVEIGSDDETAVIPEWGFGPPYFFVPPDLKMRDVPKLLIFPTDQEPQWSGLAGHPRSLLLLSAFMTGPIAWVTEHPCSLDRQQQLAYSLFHAALVQSKPEASNPEAAYILLVTAIEALLPPAQQLPGDIVTVIDTLKAKLDESDDVSEDIRNRVARLLDDDKYESISRRGRQLVRIHLGSERFGNNEKPQDYFMRSYGLRSELVHGNLDRPTFDELMAELPELRRFVLALLDQMVFGERMPMTWP